MQSFGSKSSSVKLNTKMNNCTATSILKTKLYTLGIVLMDNIGIPVKVSIIVPVLSCEPMLFDVAIITSSIANCAVIHT